MDEHTAKMNRRTFIGVTALLGVTSLAQPMGAFADPTAVDKQVEADSVRQRITQLQSEVSRSAEAYTLALYNHDRALEAVHEAQDKINETSAQGVELQEKLSARAKGMYQRGQSSLFDLLLGSSSFEDLATNWDMLNRLNENDADLIKQVKLLRDETEAQKTELQRHEKIAAEEKETAKKIKEQAEVTMVELQSLLDSLDAEALELLQKEQIAEREAATVAAAKQGARTITVGGGPSRAGGGDSGGGWNVGGYSDGNGGTSYPGAADAALTKKNCEYVWAAEGPDTFDCSGLIRWAYLQIGISLPHQTQLLYDCATWRGTVDQARKGDVLWKSSGGLNGHVGIACCDGGSWYVHAPMAGDVVRDDYSLAWSGFTHALRFG